MNKIILWFWHYLLEKLKCVLYHLFGKIKKYFILLTQDMKKYFISFVRKIKNKISEKSNKNETIVLSK